jgi:hypothetical protein
MIGHHYDEVMVGSLWRALGLQSIEHLTGLMDRYLPTEHARFCREEHRRSRHVIDGKFTEGPNEGKDRKVGRCFDYLMEDYAISENKQAYENFVKRVKEFKVKAARFILTIWCDTEQKRVQVITNKTPSYADRVPKSLSSDGEESVRAYMSHNAAVDPTMMMSEYHLCKQRKTARDRANTILLACVPSKGCVYGYNGVMGDVFMPVTWRETTLPAFKEMEYIPNPHLSATDEDEDSVHRYKMSKRPVTDAESKTMTKMIEPVYTDHWTDKISSLLELERYHDYGSSGHYCVYRALAVLANAREI